MEIPGTEFLTLDWIIRSIRLTTVCTNTLKPIQRWPVKHAPLTDTHLVVQGGPIHSSLHVYACAHLEVKLLDVWVSGGLDKEGRWKDTRYNTFNCSLNDDNLITWLQPGYSFDGPLSNCKLDSSHSLLCLPSQPKHSSYVHVSPTAIWPLTWWPPTWVTTQQSPTHFGHLMS